MLFTKPIAELVSQSLVDYATDKRGVGVRLLGVQDQAFHCSLLPMVRQRGARLFDFNFAAIAALAHDRLQALGQ